MARSVADVALFLSAIAGPDPRSPLSIAEDGARFRAPLERDFKGVRVAWWQGPGRHSVRAGDPPRRRCATGACSRISAACVEEAEPDFAGVDEAFPALRFAANHPQYAPLVRERPEWVKDTIKYEVAAGRAPDRRRCRARAGAAGADVRPEPAVLRALRLLRAARDAGVAVRRHRAVSRRRSPDTPMTTYIDWMRSCWYVTFMSNPAISVPAGFTAAGLPVGIQIVGRHRDEWSVLQMAHAFEQATQHGKRRPALLNA